MVITGRGGSKALERTLASVRSASARLGCHVEVVHVSTSPAERAPTAAHAHPDYRSVTLPSDRSAAAARNAGLAVTTAALVQFVTIGDELSPHWLTHAMAYLDTDVAVAGVMGKVTTHGAHRAPSPVSAAAVLVPTLDDTAMWRRLVVDHMQRFDPHQRERATADLCRRTRAIGFHLHRLGQPMAERSAPPAAQPRPHTRLRAFVATALLTATAMVTYSPIVAALCALAVVVTQTVVARTPAEPPSGPAS